MSLNQKGFELRKKFLDYAIYNDDGLIGVKKDAPKEAKEAYKEYCKMKKRAEKRLLKI